MTSNKVSHDDDHLDFHKIEKEVQNDVVNEERYWRENDAKIRAVEQRVPTYDDFREMVLAAHLKPLEKKDKMSSIGAFTQVWNQSAQKCSSLSPGKKNKEGEQGKMQTNDVKQVPKSGREFILYWGHPCKNSEEKKQFLFTVGANRLAELFRVEISGDLLGEFLECLLCIEDNEAKQTIDILEVLSKSQRFSLSLAFMSKNKRETCKLLFEKLKASPSVESSTLLKENLASLENVYCNQK